MPKIVVNEKDLSWYYRSRQASPLTVYMPGIATFGPSDPTLVNKDNFDQTFGSAVPGIKDEISYDMASSFVDAGLNVLFHRVLPDGAAKSCSDSAEVKVTSNLSTEKKVVVDEKEITIPAEGTTYTRKFDSVQEGVIWVREFKEAYASDFEDPSPKFEIVSETPTSVKVISNSDEVKEFTVDGESITVPAHGTYEHIFDTADKADAWISKLEEGYASDFEDLPPNLEITEIFETASGTVTSEDYEGYATITAKYEGSFGNEIKVGVSGSGNIRQLSVYVCGVLVEKLTVDFVDTRSPHYYSHVDSAFIDIDLTGEFVPETMFIDQSDISLEGGLDYGEAVKEEVIDGVIGNVVRQITDPSFLSNLRDPYLYTFNLIHNGGLNDRTNSSDKSAVDTALSALAAVRGTAIYFVDGDKEWDAGEYFEYCSLFDTSYAAAFGPWGWCSLTSDGTRVLLPGSYQMIVTWAQSISVGNPIWAAPAGVKRAKVTVLKDPRYQVGSTILDMWQNHEYAENSSYCQRINPIMRLKQYGYVIYGNSTLLKDREDGAASMLQSFNVRVLSNLIKTQAFDISLGLQFDQLDDSLFVQFKTLMGVFMDQLKYQGALYDYKIIIDRSTVTMADLNTKTVPVRIMISPNPAAENFIINLEIAQAGVTFSDDTDETEIA